MLASNLSDLKNSARGEIQDPNLPELRNLVVVDNQDAYRNQLSKLDIKPIIDWREVMLWREDTREKNTVWSIADSLTKDDVVNMQFTSGTTGLPKAVQLTHHNLLNNALSIGRCMRLTDKDIVFDAVMAEKCTALHGVPTHFLGVLSEVEKRQKEGENVDMRSLRTGIAAGTSVPIELMKQLIAKLNLRDLTNAYGMTETSPVSFQTTPDDPVIQRVETCGKVQPHVKAKVIDPEGNIVPVGKPGELCIAGYLVQKGYWEDEAQTSRVMKKDEDGTVWMHTGDEVILDGEGYIKIVGRIKDIIIRGGENLFPIQIENTLHTNPDIRESAAVAVPDKRYGEVVGAWIVRAPGSTINREDVRRVVSQGMNPQNAPAWVWFVGEDTPDELPKTASGKIMKHILRKWSKELAEKGIGSASLQTAARNVKTTPRLGFAASAAIATAIVIYSGAQRVVQNDAEPSNFSKTLPSKGVDTVQPTKSTPLSQTDVLQTFVWGSNRSQVLSKGSENDVLRLPQAAEWLNDVALRDLAFHKTHAACIDARGDVYQWGEGFSKEQNKPCRTLSGKDIVQIQLSESRLYALSSSGKIYVLAASESQQIPALHTQSPWWKKAIGLGERPSPFVEILPKDSFAWGEKFTSISAGDHHLLALTSSGKAFAHPITKEANAYGQLGIRKIQLPKTSTSGSSSPDPETSTIELIPKSLADPYAKSTPAIRESKKDGTNSEKNILSQVDDSSIGFCPTAFEIPSLKGLKVKQLVAGGRTSFALTETGRVLGWGANEFGQIGLGSNVTMDTITVPSEVALWKSVSPRAQSKCLQVTAGGDLTCYTVERVTEPSPSTVDVMMCGNGQWGGLGNNIFSNGQGAPVRARNVSELTEYNDITRTLQAIPPHSISVSPTGHVLLSLELLGGERDLLAWGKNYDSELGNGKKASMAVPVVMQNAGGERVMLQKIKAKEVKDLQGKRWKRGVVVEQEPVTGYCNSAVYWKIVD
ncbi:hypothetical protein PQX77_003898 [Marasmius sp. AFHP31]|nr:hypothetical protein PQX77_003898 [Marasmius sp. AFHP31]